MQLVLVGLRVVQNLYIAALHTENEKKETQHQLSTKSMQVLSPPLSEPPCQLLESNDQLLTSLLRLANLRPHQASSSKCQPLLMLRQVDHVTQGLLPPNYLVISYHYLDNTKKGNTVQVNAFVDPLLPPFLYPHKNASFNKHFFRKNLSRSLSTSSSYYSIQLMCYK